MVIGAYPGALVVAGVRLLDRLFTDSPVGAGLLTGCMLSGIARRLDSFPAQTRREPNVVQVNSASQ
jgi:hypothetical protein